jgi:hypothetical protein
MIWKSMAVTFFTFTLAFVFLIFFLPSYISRYCKMEPSMPETGFAAIWPSLEAH